MARMRRGGYVRTMMVLPDCQWCDIQSLRHKPLGSLWRYFWRSLIGRSTQLHGLGFVLAYLETRKSADDQHSTSFCCLMVDAVWSQLPHSPAAGPLSPHGLYPNWESQLLPPSLGWFYLTGSYINEDSNTRITSKKPQRCSEGLWGQSLGHDELAQATNETSALKHSQKSLETCFIYYILLNL